MPDTLELELDGHIYTVEKDEEGNIISREELDGEMCLRLLIRILEDAIEDPEFQKKFMDSVESGVWP